MCIYHMALPLLITLRNTNLVSSALRQLLLLNTVMIVNKGQPTYCTVSLNTRTLRIGKVFYSNLLKKHSNATAMNILSQSDLPLTLQGFYWEQIIHVHLRRFSSQSWGLWAARERFWLQTSINIMKPYIMISLQRS